MSVTNSATNEKPGTEIGRPHSLHLAVSFTDKTTGRHVEFNAHLPRQATRKADIENACAQLAKAVEQVLHAADEGCDAVITLALLHKVRP